MQAFSEVGEPRGGELAERFRPRLKSTQPVVAPAELARLLEERDGDRAAHRFCRPGSDCANIDNDQVFKSEASRTNAAGRPTYIDLAGSSKNQYRGPFRCDGFADCGRGPRSAIYYHVTHSNDRFYIDYWWFLRFNNFYLAEPKATCRSKEARKNGVCDEHEGDWEGVTAVTQPGDELQLDYVVYAAHKGTFRYSAAELVPDGEKRPTVYVARGSHASYPRSCDPEVKISGRPRFVCSQPIAVRGSSTSRSRPSTGAGRGSETLRVASRTRSVAACCRFPEPTRTRTHGPFGPVCGEPGVARYAAASQAPNPRSRRGSRHASTLLGAPVRRASSPVTAERWGAATGSVRSSRLLRATRPGWRRASASPTPYLWRAWHSK